jgi:2-dehydro-3-deoxy-D-arabinonate dehydratase
MKLYKVEGGIVIEWNNEYRFVMSDFDSLLVKNNIKNYLEKIFSKGVKTKISNHKILAPIGSRQELWACGVTYLNSKLGRQEESKNNDGGEFYERVYHAIRPEVFFKANPSRIVGHKDKVRIRKDSSWDVPEPELTLVVSPTKKIIGYTIGNDMSSRSIEGENPLYLPQAKTYDACAALGPCIVFTNPFVDKETKITLTIKREKKKVFNDSVLLSQMKRKKEELVNFVYKECSFPYGCLIMTGTGIVPPKDFTLMPDDKISISIDGIGELINEVQCFDKQSK